MSKPASRGRHAEPAPLAHDPRWGLVVFAWSMAAHLAQLLRDPLLDAPVTALFFGDSLHFLTAARARAEGLAGLGTDLPFHPPMVAWLLLPLWRILATPASVFVAAKVLMALINAATFAGVFLLLRPRLPRLALPIALILPLGFGEILLSSTANSEAVYRLLLVALLLLGPRWPLVAGLLHGLAALTRAEHLLLVGVGATVASVLTRDRRVVALTLLGAALVVVPYASAVRADLVAYNRAHADEIPEPLPTLVPVSFYGPLNFALAQREETIFFSRRTLPVSRGEAAALDPLDPAHNRVIVHGYRLGLEEIALRPDRFARRSLQKAAHSLRAFTQGWTGRDAPKPALWVRRPVDMAISAQPAYAALVAALAALGAWALRGDRTLLTVGLLVVLYRLSFGIAFFPYLRGMMIAAPFVATLALVGLAAPLRRAGPRVLWVLLALLATYHLAAGPPSGCRLHGERDASGTILDDRTLIVDCRPSGRR